MAHVPLAPIGRERRLFVDEPAFAENFSEHEKLRELLSERRAEVHRGWGDKYIERVRAKGKLTTRERISQLIDPDSQVLEVGTFVNWGLEFAGGLRSPGAGVVTAFVQVAARWCMVIANDNTVASGSWWPGTPEKIQRAQEMARRLRLPVIYLVDCSGLYLPEQARSFAGGHGAGHIFQKNSVLSAEGVPQLAGVFGDCIAGGGYMPIISDRVYMTESAYMVIAGAALIKGAKGQALTSLEIGGPEVHVHESGCADVRVPDDATLLRALRREVDRLPTSGAAFYRAGVGAARPSFSPHELAGLVPRDHRENYPAEEVLARLCDLSLFWECQPTVGHEVLCGIGRLGGLYAGFVINRLGLFDHPHKPGSKRPGGSLYKQGIAKMAAFGRACDADGIPVFWLQDVAGFDIGVEAERQGLLGYGSSLIYANSTHQTPMFSVLLRKASGAGYYAMKGLPYAPVVQLSTPFTRLGVMEGRTLAIATYRSKLDEQFAIRTEDEEERKAIVRGMDEVEARIEAEMDPYLSAQRMDTDEIVSLEELRGWLCALTEMTYQSSGVRRTKNPRIWSLHDLEALFGAGSPGVQQSPSIQRPSVPRRNSDRALVEDDFDDSETVFRAPSAGRIFLKPAPDQPAFVGVGDRVQAGQTLALLEVMKTFHRLSYEGADLPAEATVARIACDDAAEVSSGQPLFVFSREDSDA